jgi:anti-sigma factor RsiW
MNCLDYKEIIAAHVDGMLAAEEEQQVQVHLEQCSRCKQFFRWETEVKKLLREKISPVTVQPSFKEELLERLEGRRKRTTTRYFYQRYAIAALVLLFFALTPRLFPRNQIGNEAFSQAVVQYQTTMRKVFEDRISSPSSAARSFDLSPWGYRLIISETSEFNGLSGITSTYQNQKSDYVLAQEFEGGNLSVPAGAKSVQAAGKSFVMHSQNGVNVIAWKERNLLCLLASPIPMEHLLDMAQRVMA